MKKIFKKFERGSIMIEALAMLALIAMVTPLLYKKSAERMRELQDINSASELRSIIKAVDDYISSNYNTLIAGGTVTNTCTAGSYNSKSYEAFKDADEKKRRVIVDIGHFCEFLPYGILDASGKAKVSKLFGDYKVVLKLKGNAADGANNVITAFVVTDPRVDMPQIRSSSIASMIGGNGGYVDDNTGHSGTAASQGSIAGNLGLWGINNTSDELGIEVKKGAVVAASIQGISSQNANIDINDVLYRKSRTDKDLNTMSTTLYMGDANGNSFGNEIQNIGRLVLGQKSATGDDRIYITTGNIRIGGKGEINIDGAGKVSLGSGDFTTTTGDFTATTQGSFTTKSGSFTTKNGDFQTTKGQIRTDDGFLIAKKGGLQITENGTINVNSSVFSVAADGVTKALNFQTNDGNVTINVDSKTTVKQPVVITSNGSCTYDNATGCALQVTGSAHIGGDLYLKGTLDANNLHARTKLTAGGNTPATAAFSADTANLTYSGSTGVSLAATTDKKLVLNSTGTLLQSDSNKKLVLESTGALLQSDSNNKLEIGLNNETKRNEAALTSPEIKLNNTLFYLNKTTGNNKISSDANSFKISPSGRTGYFEVANEGSDENKGAQMIANAMNVYVTGTSTAKSKLTQKNSDYYLQNSSGKDIVHMGDAAGTTSQIDISPNKITAKNSDGTQILKIDLENTSTTNTKLTDDKSESYPVYIRKGIIELNAGDNNNYVKADRFISHKSTDSGDLRKINIRGTDDGRDTISAADATNYIINPAYTSVMKDIKLTSRGGARLSDILPDFINKGIYVVDNTYPAKGQTCGATNAGVSLAEYIGTATPTGGADLAIGKSDHKLKGYKKFQDAEDGSNYVGSCTSDSEEVSSWLGFIPRPMCPPGYIGVITITPISFNMAQVGNVMQKSDRKGGRDGRVVPADLVDASRNPVNPLDITSGDVPTPVYNQKNTWLKSYTSPYPRNCLDNQKCKGWDAVMGFIYPYNWFAQYIKDSGYGETYNSAGVNAMDSLDDGTASESKKVIWNLFPVYAGSLEGYATVYCYFQRGGGGWGSYNSATVDTSYDQLGDYRIPYHWIETNVSKRKSNYNSLNAPDYDYGDW